MLKSAARKVMWVGRATTFMVGLAVVLALSVGVASSALAGTGVGATFNLGQTNTVSAISKLVGSVAGPNLVIDNNSTNAAATALDLQVEAGKAPMKVNSATKVANLNADKLDGVDSSGVVRNTYVTSVSAGQTPGVAFCDAGDVATGGGYAGVDAGTTVLDSTPGLLRDGSSPSPVLWRVDWQNDSTPDTVLVEVVCADLGAAHQ